MKLVIFDLDQTLVDFISVHDEVTRKLFKRFFDVDARLIEIDFAGKSLSESFYELAKLKNVPEDVFRKKSHQLLESYETAFGQMRMREKGFGNYLLS
jgi:beta-phosphoglucomutase-like phosphatase (HAD superfamily)